MDMSTSTSTSTGGSESKMMEIDHDSFTTVMIKQTPPELSPLSSSSLWRNRKKKKIKKKNKVLSRQLSMRETSLELAWEKRKRRYLTKEAALNESLTDDDLDELKGSIELGFGFEEENGGHNLRGTLPALDLYFHVNRQLQVSSPSSASTPSDSRSCSFGSPSPRSPHHFSDSNWKICTPGDNPEDVKTRLRHWAQAVACSLKQQSR